tara:strand:- start:297 stop:398 length:102 start_codon:yes stop_codon:yes gene_type:complete
MSTDTALKNKIPTRRAMTNFPSASVATRENVPW